MAFSPHDVVPDSPINNFATLNPLNHNKDSSLTTEAMYEGNLKYRVYSASYYYSTSATIALRGKHYWEVYCVGSPNLLGIIGQGKLPDRHGTDIGGIGAVPYGYAFRYNRTEFRNNNTSVLTGLTAYGNLDIVSFCFDATTGNLWYAINGNWQQSGNPSTGTNPLITVADDIYTPAVSSVDGSSTYAIFNFGQDHTFGGATLPASAGSYTADNGIGTFAYQPPAGALALCTQNIPSGPIDVANDDVPSDYFKAVTWTNPSTDTDVTVPLEFQPDLIWWKQRNVGNSHRFQDMVRGLGNILVSNSTNANAAFDVNTNKYNVKTVASTGFTFNGYSDATTRGGTMVGWCWKAAGAPADGQAKIINEDGSDGTMSTADLASAAGASITPSKVSANRKSGFSIVKYSGSATDGATVPHGLSYAPDMWIAKCSSHAKTWFVYHKDLSSGNVLMLNDPDHERSGFWGGEPAAPDQNFLKFAKGTGSNGVPYYDNVNHTGQDYIAYCWHSVPGYSKFGSYTSNGSNDGPMINLSFKPSLILLKVASGSVASSYWSWCIYDNSRNEYNPAHSPLYTNHSVAEGLRGNGSGTNGYALEVDFLSNGFKVRTNATEFNSSDTQTVIYCAWAESPFNAPSNAR